MGLLDYNIQAVTYWSFNAHRGMPQISHNFTKVGLGNQGLPDPYSSASFGTDKGWQSLPLVL